MANKPPSRRVARPDFTPPPKVTKNYPSSSYSQSASGSRSAPLRILEAALRAGHTRGLMDAVLSPIRQARKRKRSYSDGSVSPTSDGKEGEVRSPMWHDDISGDAPRVHGCLEHLVPDYCNVEYDWENEPLGNDLIQVRSSADRSVDPVLNGEHDGATELLGNDSAQAYSTADLFVDPLPRAGRDWLTELIGNNPTQVHSTADMLADPLPDVEHDRVTEVIGNNSAQVRSAAGISQADPLPRSMLLERPIGLPLGRPPLLRRTLTCFFPTELGGALQDASLLYDPYSKDLKVSICVPTPMIRPLFHGSEDIWMPGHKISGLFIVLGHGAEARHYQAALWIIHWVRCYLNASVKGIIVNVPLTCSSLTDADIKHLYDPLTFSGRQVASLPLFPNMHSLLWSGDARFLRRFLANATSCNLKVIQIQSQLCIKDAQWLLRRFSTSKIHTLEIKSLTDDVPPILKEDIQGHAFRERLPFSLPFLDTLKLELISVADFGAFFDGVSLPKLCSFELILADTATIAESLYYLTEEPLFGESLRLVNIVCEEGHLIQRGLPYMRIGIGIKELLPKAALLQFIDRAGNCYGSLGPKKVE